MTPTRSFLLASIALSSVALGMAQAQPARPPEALTIHAIKDGELYWIEGGGGNSGVIVGDKGVVVIDAKTTAESGAQLVAAIESITPKPITTVIETHSDGDHVNGIVSFPLGIRIIAHVNNKVEQQMVPLYAAVEVDGGRCLPPQDRLPNQLVYGSKAEATLEGKRFIFYHFGPAHTNGDLVVYLPAYKLAFAGDLITNSVLIHPEKNGSLEGWFNNAKGLLGLEAQSYLGGHAKDLDTKDSLRERIKGYQLIRDEVDGLMKDGKSLAEVKAAMGDPAKDPSGCRGIPYPSLAQDEYNEQTDRNEQLK